MKTHEQCSRSVSGSFQERPNPSWGVLEASWEYLGAPRARLNDVPECFQGSPKRPRSTPGAPRDTPERPDGAAERLGSDLGSVFKAKSVRLASIFHSFYHASSGLAMDDGTNTASQKKAERSTTSILAHALCDHFVLRARLSKILRIIIFRIMNHDQNIHKSNHIYMLYIL